ncbi:MAG: acyltransferase [Bacteroidales bacterium]|nr:acyltransferase [Candidatus Colimorpha onthohippi]
MHRYATLDGLRGIAALAVLVYHLFEAVAFANGDAEQQMFHGFLAVDFFFLLSGFVMGHAYDNKMNAANSHNRLTFCRLMLTRIIRLHPMIIIGSLTGLIVYIAQGCTRWDGTMMPWSTILIGFILSLLIIPSPLSNDLRGNTEAFPLNGPSWSLFLEYVGSILYGLILHKLKTRHVAYIAVVSALGYAAIGILTYGDESSTLAFGWSSTTPQLIGGLLRMLTSYTIGLTLWRLIRHKRPSSLHPTVSCCIAAMLLTALLCTPSLGNLNLWYEWICICVVFPIVIWIAASESTHTTPTILHNTCTWIGELSYPLYAIHYPLIYLYIGWINQDLHPFGPYSWCTPVAIAAIAILAAVACMRLYDRPVRNWLTHATQQKR